MRLAVRYELTLLATVPATRVLLIVGTIGALLVAAGLCFVVQEAGTADTAAGASESLAIVLTRSPLTVLVVGLIAAMSLGHDYRFRTIDVTLLVTPRRTRAFAAKALTVAMCGAGLALLSLVLAWTVAVVMLGTDVVGRASVGPLLQAQAGYVGFVTGWGLLGLALTRIFASQTFAILTLVIWPLVVEPALRGMTSAMSWEPLRDAAAYLPYAAGQALSSTPRAGSGSLYSGAHAASPAIAALAFIGLTVAAIWASAVMFRNRPAVG
jgi:ABC-2 type transport system permease protein